MHQIPNLQHKLRCLYQMVQGEAVTFRDYPNRNLKLVNGYIQDSISDGFWNRKSGNEFLSYASSPGWQIYEPKPESQYKVGDWVEFIDVGGRKSQGKYLSNDCDHAIIVLDMTCNMQCVVPTRKIIRKISPFEVIVKIGCLSGTIKKSCDYAYFSMRHSSPEMDRNYSVIKFSALDTQTRELVESLLRAQEEESNEKESVSLTACGD